MKVMLDMTVPIAGAGADPATDARAADDAPGHATAPLADRQSLPWTLIDDYAGPLWSYVRGARRMVEVAASTRVGDRRHHANQDAAVVEPMPDGSLVVAVLDAISGSLGVDVGQFRRKLVDDFALLLGSGSVKPIELVRRLDREAQRWLDRVAPDAATGAAIVVVRIDVDSGRVDWASAGDIRLLAFGTARPAWLAQMRRSRARVLNAPARSTTSNRLTAAVGQSAPLRIEAGAMAMRPGHMLVLSTDGASAPLGETSAVLRAYADGNRLAGLEGLVNRLDRLAVEFAHGTVDDRTIVALAEGRST